MSSALTSTIHKPMIEHVRDLQKHLTWIAVAVAICSGIAYGIHEQLFQLLQKPLNQTLYYTSPTGGFAFLFKLCIVAGIVLALPAILFNIFRFLEPVLDDSQRKGTYKYVFWSFILAYGGITFAYFLSLPYALHFLTSVGGDDIKSLINVNDYFNFALAYVAGFAFLFQIPLIILFLNRIKPLKPKKMMSAQRYIIVASFIVAAVLTPTPDPFNQAMMAAPMIVLYQVSIVLVILANRKHRKAVAKRAKKAATRGSFAAIATANLDPQPIPTPQPLPQAKPAAAVTTTPKPHKQPAQSMDFKPLPRRRQHISDVSRPAVTARRTQYTGARAPIMPPRPVAQTTTPRARLIGNDFLASA